MQQLSLGHEKTNRHDGDVRNPFLKLALLTSLSIASQLTVTDIASAKPAAETKIVAGKYHCSPPKFKGITPWGLMPTASEMILSENNGSLSMTDQTGFTMPVKRTAHGFTFKTKSGKVTVSGSGQFLADGTLRASI